MTEEPTKPNPQGSPYNAREYNLLLTLGQIIYQLRMDVVKDVVLYDPNVLSDTRGEAIFIEYKNMRFVLFGIESSELLHAIEEARGVDELSGRGSQ